MNKMTCWWLWNDLKRLSNDPDMDQKWPKIDILMTLSRSHFKMVHWLNVTGYRRNRIDEMCSNEIHSMIHWYSDLLNIPILILKRSRNVSNRPRYRLAVFDEDGTAKARAENYFLVYFWDSDGQKVPYLSINDHHWNPQKSTKCYLYRNLCRFELSESYDIDTWPLITWLLK